MARFIRIKADNNPGSYVDLLPHGTEVVPDEAARDLLDLAIARLRESNRREPARPKSVALTNMEQAALWLDGLAEGKVR